MSWGCHDKLLQMWRLETIESIVSQCWGQKSGVRYGQGSVASDVSRGEFFLLNQLLMAASFPWLVVASL